MRASEATANAEKLAERIANKRTICGAHDKAAIRRGLALEIRDAARAEAVSQAQSIVMDDAREGNTALLEKRDPVFTRR